MTLTTPVPRDSDAVFPGENWFFYWKTSSSLWRDKLASLPGNGRVVVPINWSYHSDTGDSFDFADNKPETDLKKLADIASELGHELVFFLPITPAPFLPNGGIPHLLARSFALNLEGMAYAVRDADGATNKLYSFFDSRVFQAFSKFVHHLGRYFSEVGIASDVWAMECGYLDQGEFTSYFHDRSKTFDQGFSRFLNVRKEQPGFNGTFSSPRQEDELKNEFTGTIENLYLDAAKQALSGHWEGKIRVSFLGGSNSDYFERMSLGFGQAGIYSEEIYRCLCQDALPSSVLLPSKGKQGILERQLEEIVTNSYLQLKLQADCYENDGAGLFAPLTFFYICTNLGTEDFWNKVGLRDFLEDHFPWCYQLRTMNNFNWSESEAIQNKVYFLQGDILTQEHFQVMLKLFMSGGRVVLNQSGMAEELRRRLHSFFIENSLKVEKVNFQTDIVNVCLGEGRLLVFEGDKLLDLSFEKNIRFWQKLIETFDLTHLGFSHVEGVNFHWRTRPSSHSELNYEEVRRLSLYNPTSYKKKVKINVSKNFVLMKVLDELNVSVQSHPHSLELEFLPEGSLSLDFGVFSHDG